MPVNTFDVIQRRKTIILFKIGKLWVFKHFFDDKAIFKALAENYHEDKFRFEFKTFGARNQALKLLERAGFDYELEDLRPYVVKISRYSNMHHCLRTPFPSWKQRTGEYSMKDIAAVEEALRLGAEPYQGDYDVLAFR